jgi:hypothetical protein
MTDEGGPISTDEWLLRIEAAGRELRDPIDGIDQLDDITQKKISRPTMGWMEKHTKYIAS